MALTLVAVHGNGGGGFRFERIKPFLLPQTRFQAVTLPGFAGLPALPDLQSLGDYARYLHSLIHNFPRPLVLLGHGIGGSIVLEYAQHYALTLDALILHAPVGTRLNTRLFPRLMRLPGMRRLGQQVFASPLSRPVLKRLLFSEPVPPAYLDRFFGEYGQCQVFGQMFDLITADWFAGLHPVGCPAALLWGEQERVLSVDQLADYQALLPQAITHTVPGWDHFPMIEQPQAYAAELDRLARDLLRPGKETASRAE